MLEYPLSLKEVLLTDDVMNAYKKMFGIGWNYAYTDMYNELVCDEGALIAFEKNDKLQFALEWVAMYMAATLGIDLCTTQNSVLYIRFANENDTSAVYLAVKAYSEDDEDDVLCHTTVNI